MRTEHTKIPIIAFAILMVSSFVPFIHILLVQSASLLYVITHAVFGETPKDILNLVFLLVAALCLFLYYQSHERISTIFYAIVSIACLMSYAMILLESIEIEPYYLSLMIISTVACFPLWVVGLVKENHVAELP